MRRLWMWMALVAIFAVPAMAYGEGIITPSAAGVATGSAYFPLQNAFDGQPTWDSQSEMPTGGGSGNDAPYYASRHGYIDFGADWADVRITGTWTMYRAWSSGNQVGYSAMWWDDDYDNVNDNGVSETALAFNSAQGLNTGGATPWIQDVDCSSNPIAPQRRYLILASASTMTNRAKEYAIVGYTVSNVAPSVDAGSDASVTLPNSASLDGTVSDDGLPNPPASVTVTWSKISGPGTVTFGNANAVDTTASFSAAGTYVLRLTADDGDLTAYDEVTITVNAAATETDIITPAAAGVATGSAYFPLENAFDGQPTWDDVTEVPTGGGSGNDAPAYGSRHGYIDFGTNWPDVRITGTWTMYRTWSGGNHSGYAVMWWDDDKDNVNDNGVTESTLNFNSAQGLSNIGYTQWAKDVDCSANPITPQRRYLIIGSPATVTNRAKEYAIVGYLQAGSNNAPIVDAGEDDTITLPSTAELVGYATDDNRPDPPASITVAWTKTSGPGTVTFGNDDSLMTSAIFSTSGTYVLRLTADDGDLTAYDEVTITVNAAGDKPAMKDFIGINVHCGAIFQSGEPGIPALYAPTTSLIRDYHPMGWDVNTTDAATNFPRDKWNWINWSTLYNTFVSAGYQVDACIQFSAFGDGDWVDPAADAYDYGYAFARAFGPTYGSGVVTSVQIGNEPGNMSDNLYITVFENMAEGIRAGDSALMIVTCNTQNSPSGTYHKSVSLFEDITDLVDAFAIHTYPMLTGWPNYTRSYPEDPQLLDYLTSVASEIAWRDANAPDSEVWITEFGYDSSSTSWSGNVTRNQHAQWLIRSFLIWSTMDMQRAYMYYYNDDNTASYHACSGLTVNWDPKPAYYAQSHLQDMLGDYKFNRAIQKTAGDVYILEYVDENDADNIVWVAWSPTGSDRTTNVTMTGMPGAVQWAQRMPLTSGSAPSVSYTNLGSGSISISVTESPVYIQMVAN